MNLVFQQCNVLQCGLDHRVQGICGAMGASLWTKSTWDKHFDNNMVIVCTAEVLVQCMMHSFINMRRVNLLIFDEAHHAKNNHPYARLIKEYYLAEPDLSQRPRIFGMTASPVDANVDIRKAARDLETLLHCKIATTSDITLLQSHITKPAEDCAKYAPLGPPFKTPFFQELEDRYGSLKVYKRLFRTALILSSELGRWASDTYWSFAFSEEESRKTELRRERTYHKTNEVTEGHGSVDKLNEEIAQLREAAEYVQSREFPPPSATSEDLSSKVLMLHQWLRSYYERTGHSRCIVFVERRQTARLLNMIFSEIGGPHLHGEILIGNASTMGDLNYSLRTQIMTVARFRRGELNCLFATSVAEEGLDIPQCNLVVRFDLYRTMIAYVQSRGRARHRNSKYLHMVEEYNEDHRGTLQKAKQSEQIMRQFCNGLSSDRYLDDANDDIETLLANEAYFPTYTDPGSGARLTYRSSLSVLAHFTAVLPGAGHDVTLLPTYVTSRADGKFVSEVVLPDCSPIVSLKGHPQSKKIMAKCSAAFEMCVALRKKGHLDESLLPTCTRQLPAMRNALLAISPNKKDQYPMRIKPEFWQHGFGTVPGELYLTVIDVSAGLERPHQPIGLVTRKGFPKLPEFPIYLADGTPSDVISVPLTSPFAVTDETLKLLTDVTLQVYSDIFAKVYENDVSKMTYWLVPLRAELKTPVAPAESPEHLIDWEQVREIAAKNEYRWSPAMSNDFLANKYIVDLNDGGRRFYSKAVAPQYKATDPVPRSAPTYKYMDSILEYSVSLWAKSRVKWKDVWNQDQPVVEVEKIPFRRNFLAHVEKDEEAEARWNPIAYVCPQPLKISALTIPFVAMCYVFPAIIYRFDAYLVALDACARLDLNIGPRLALEALTKDSDNTEDHGEEQIRFKSGMGPNYERLEFIGDCLLKLATTLSVFVQQPEENEFEFHVRRMLMLCNKNLFNAALKLELYEYVRTMAFSRRTWYPEGLKLIKGKGMKRDGPQVIKHQLGDKSIADVCEAFIGAAFMEHNDINTWAPEKWDQAVKAVKIMVDNEDHLMERFSDYYAAYQKPTYQLAEATASQIDLARKIEQRLPYHFQYPRLLRSAFIHPSQAYMWENIPNYQRLEFLGDALLDQVFITHIFYEYPEKDPQWLTEHKMPMVSNKFLGALCVSLGFHTHIRQNNAALTSQIKDYVVEVQEAEREAKGALNYWTTVSEPPKCLADVVEAYVAAVFVDSEFDFRPVQQFFDMHIKRFFEDMTLYDDFANNHPVTRLRNIMEVNFGCKEHRIGLAKQQSVIPGAKEQVIGMVMIHNQVRFHKAGGTSHRYARLKVAQLAVEKLEGLPPFEFRRLYGCDCEDREAAETAVDVGPVGEALNGLGLNGTDNADLYSSDGPIGSDDSGMSSSNGREGPAGRGTVSEEVVLGDDFERMTGLSGSA